MPTQNVNLTPELNRFVEEQISSGYFNNASEVHRSALAAMAREEEEHTLKLEWLKQEIALGIAQLDAGEGMIINSSEDLENLLDGSFEQALADIRAADVEKIP